MEFGNPADLLANSTAIVGFVIVIAYVGKQLLEWIRGDKSVESEWRSRAITDALAGHNALKDMYDNLKKELDELQGEVQESRRREAVAAAKHQEEIARLRANYAQQIEELEAQLRQLRRRLDIQEDK